MCSHFGQKVDLKEVLPCFSQFFSPIEMKEEEAGKNYDYFCEKARDIFSICESHKKCVATIRLLEDALDKRFAKFGMNLICKVHQEFSDDLSQIESDLSLFQLKFCRVKLEELKKRLESKSQVIIDKELSCQDLDVPSDLLADQISQLQLDCPYAVFNLGKLQFDTSSKRKSQSCQRFFS